MTGEGLATGSHFERGGAMDPPTGPRCDKCGAVQGQGWGRRSLKVIRFGLEHRPKHKLGRGRIAKHISLCQTCWEGLAQ
jgi:hypothetical protein